MGTTLRLWLRAESKPGERRTPLVPRDAAVLVRDGVELTVERSPLRVHGDEEYRAAGARLADPGAWLDAPADAVIFGLKELPEDDFPLRHRHLYFAHAYKGQKGWRELLDRFARGKGTLLDLEYLVDDSGRRVAAFGRWAGFAGAAVGADLWAHQKSSPNAAYAALSPFKDQDALVERVRARLAGAGLPSVLVFGAKGRCGSGALELLRRAGVTNVTAWDKEETAAGGPFDESLKHELMVNCVLLSGPTRPFLTREMLDRPRRLSVISDVSCDPYSPHNPVPVYDRTTTFESPALRLRESPALDLTAIDHLPSLLPRESSEDFSGQLLPHLRALGAGAPVWARAAALFREKAAEAAGALRS